MGSRRRDGFRAGARWQRLVSCGRARERGKGFALRPHPHPKEVATVLDDGDFATWVWGGSRRVARAPDRSGRERNRDEETIIVLTTATTFLSFHSPLSANHHRDVLEQRR